MANYYTKATEAYSEIISEVTTIGQALEEFMKEKGQEFSAQVFVNQFDCILQYSLLQYAVADGNLEYDELKLIVDITKYADLLDYINSHYSNSVTWNDVLNGKVESIQKWLDNNYKYMAEIAEQFTTAFAFVDKAVENKDINSILSDKCATIMVALGFADGDVSDAESNSVKDNLMAQVVGVINAKIKG